MKVVLVTNKYAIPNSAREWQLYDHMAGAEFAAQQLTKATEEAIAMICNGDDPRTGFSKAMRHMDRVSTEYDRYGACDSEPQAMIDNILEDCLEAMD